MKRKSETRAGRRCRALLAPLACFVLGTTGCTPMQVTKGDTGIRQVADNDEQAKKDETAKKDEPKSGKWYREWYDPSTYFLPEPPSAPAETLTLGAEGFVTERPPEPGTAVAEMA